MKIKQNLKEIYKQKGRLRIVPWVDTIINHSITWLIDLLIFWILCKYDFTYNFKCNVENWNLSTRREIKQTKQFSKRLKKKSKTTLLIHSPCKNHYLYKNIAFTESIDRSNSLPTPLANHSYFLHRFPTTDYHLNTADVRAYTERTLDPPSNTWSFFDPSSFHEYLRSKRSWA